MILKSFDFAAPIQLLVAYFLFGWPGVILVSVLQLEFKWERGK